MKFTLSKTILLVALFSLTSEAKAQLTSSNTHVEVGLTPSVINESGRLKFFTPSPIFVSPTINVLGLHSQMDASPISIGGNHVYFVPQNFSYLFSDESDNNISGTYSKVFVPGQLRIGTNNTSWNNFKLKIVTSPTNAPFLNGMHIDHRKTSGYSFGFLMTVNHNNTRAIVVENNLITGQPTKEVFRVDGSGTVFCSQLRVMQAGNFPDYVFDPDYNLLSLNDLRTFINNNKHLPNVPSACEIASSGGFEVGNMTKVLLEKVEELTLYTLELYDINKDLSRKNEELKNRLEHIEKLMQIQNN